MLASDGIGVVCKWCVYVCVCVCESWLFTGHGRWTCLIRLGQKLPPVTDKGDASIKPQGTARFSANLIVRMLNRPEALGWIANKYRH